MKRLLLLMLSLLLVLALVGCGKAKEDPDADAADANVLTNGEQLPITEAGALEYDNSSVTCRFRKDEEGWKWVDNETFPLDAAYVEEILTALDTMSAELTPLDPTVDPAECGLDESNRYMTVTVGEEVTTLRFGDQKDDGTWYMSIDGQEGVYLVEDAFVTLMDRSIYDMAVLPTLPELTDENLTVITVHQTESGKSVRLTKNDEGWVSGGKALPDGIEAIETALAELSFDKCFDYDPSPGRRAPVRAGRAHCRYHAGLCQHRGNGGHRYPDAGHAAGGRHLLRHAERRDHRVPAGAGEGGVSAGAAVSKEDVSCVF